MVENRIIRVVSRESDGTLRTRDYDSIEALGKIHYKVGVDDCSTNLSLRGMPVYRGLIGPISESKSVVSYESPEVFESMTKEWADKKSKRRRRRSPVPAPAGAAVVNAGIPNEMVLSETV